jgi:predicted NAD/FAD-dependent oxidoreductase
MQNGTDLNDAIGKVLFHMSQMNDTMTFNYVAMDDWELHIQEDSALEWARALVAASPYPQANQLYLEMYEDSLTEFQAKRACVTFSARGEDPPGFEVWKSAQGRPVLVNLKEGSDIEEEGSDEDDEYSETQVLNTLNEFVQFFKDNTLNEAAKKLQIDRSDAADLKVAIPLLIERKKSEE